MNTKKRIEELKKSNSKASKKELKKLMKKISRTPYLYFADFEATQMILKKRIRVHI